MSPNDPLFGSQMTTWCPRCAKAYTASAGELSHYPGIDCEGCQYSYEVDTWDLQAEIAARRLADAARQRVVNSHGDGDVHWQDAAFAARGQRSLYPVWKGSRLALPGR